MRPLPYLPESVDDTARLIVMEHRDSPQFGPRFFLAELRRHEDVGLADAMGLWRAYLGSQDHHLPPTHNVETGGRLVGGAASW